MAIYAANTLETGAADGTAITPANSGGAAGRAFDVVDGGASYSTLAAHGGLSALLDQATSGRCQLQWIDTANTPGTCWARFYLFATATPSGNTRILHFNDFAGAQAFALQWRSDGVVRLYDGPSQNMAQSTWTMPVGQWVRVEVMVVLSATAGQAELRIYAADPEGSTPDQTLTSDAAYNTLGSIGMWRWGPTAGPDNLVLRMDDLAVSFDDWIGPAAAPAVHGTAAIAATATVAGVGRKRAHGSFAIPATTALDDTGHKRAHSGLDLTAATAMSGSGAQRNNRLELTATTALAGTGRKIVHGTFAATVTAELTGAGGAPGHGNTLDLATRTTVAFHGAKPRNPPPPPPPVPRPDIDWRKRGQLYTYEFADFLTDSTLAVLDLEDVVFDRRICMAGSFKATVPVPNPEVAAQVQRIVPRDDTTIATGPGRTVVHVYRGEAIWGTYIIWSATLKSDERGRITVDLQGASLESYLDHREIREDVILVQADQDDIARYLVAHMQSQGQDSSVGIEVGGQAASGIIRDRTYLASEAATYGQRLTELSQVIDGPEWMIRTWQDPDTGRRRREFIVGGRLGSEDTRHIFTQPGDVISWSYPADATSTATSWQTRGDTIQDDVTADSEPLLSGIWENPAYRAAGWPLLERTEDYQGVTLVSTLNEYARWWASQRSGMIRIPQVDVRLDRHTDWNPNNLGDSAQLKLLNLWWPGGFDRRWRAIGCEITPPTRTDGVEKMRLIFQEPKDEAASERVNGGPPEPPATPTGLHVERVDETSVSLIWDAVSDADAYHLFQDGQMAASPTTPSYLAQGLAPSTSYQFTVSAVNEGGESEPGAAVTATTSAPQT